MPLATALELVLNQYGIYDIDDLVDILRSPHDASRVADLINDSRALIAATAQTANVTVQTDTAIQRRRAQPWTAMSTCVR